MSSTKSTEESYSWMYEKETAWFCIPPSFGPRRFLMWLIRWLPFLALIQISILVNSAMLGAYEPLNPDSPRNYAINVSEYVFFGIFAFECVAKLFAMGAFLHRGAYFRDGWNWLDFIIVVMSLISIMPLEGGSNLTAIRSLRILRSLRLLGNIRPLRVLIESLIASIPDIANALVFLGAMLLGWSVMGMQAFGGKFLQHCVDPSTGLFNPDATCAVNFTGQGWLCESPLVCTVTTVNPAYGRINYDNFAAAFMQAFQVVTQEDWSVIATFAMDSTSAGAIVYYAVEILFGTLILVNLFVAILTGVLEKVRAADKLREPSPDPSFVMWLKQQRKSLADSERGRDERWHLFAVMHKIVKSFPFNLIVYLLIFINFIVLSMEHFPMSSAWDDALNLTNIVLNSLFSAEVVMRLIGLGLYKWASDGFNVFDLCVVVGSWIELALTQVTILRILRSLRMFRILVHWTSFRRILRTVGIAIKGSVFFLFLYALIIYIFAVVGMQVFGGQFFFVDTYPRWNFDSLWNSAMTVFVVISGDNWPQPLSGGFRAIGWSGCIYFIVLVALGAWVVLKLFLAILLGAFEEEHQEENKEEEVTASIVELSTVKLTTKRLMVDGDEDDDGEEPDEEDKELPVTGLDVAIVSSSKAGMQQERVLRALGVAERRHYATVEELQQEEQTRLDILHEDEEKNKNVAGVHLSTKHQITPHNALFVFSPSNPFRVALFELVTSVVYEFFIFVMIVVSCVFVAIDNSYWRTDQSWMFWQSGAELCFLVVFASEMFFKIVAYGLLLHEGSYLRDPWNVLDFIVVFLSVLSIILGSLAGIDLSFLRGLRAFRAFRLLGRFQTTRVTVKALIRSIPAVFNVIVFSVFMW